MTPLDRYYNNGELVKDFLNKCLCKDPAGRLSAFELMDHPWIKTMVVEEEMTKSEKAVFVQNLADFKDATLFQSSVITFLVRLKAVKEDSGALRRIFTQSDTDRDGFLTFREIE